MPIPLLKDAPAVSPAGNFIAMLQGKTGGVSLHELDRELAEVVKAVRATGKPGTLTYTLKIKRNAKRGMRIVDDVKTKIPQEDIGESFFYTNEHGALLRNNPDGPDLPGLVAVPDEPLTKPISVSA